MHKETARETRKRENEANKQNEQTNKDRKKGSCMHLLAAAAEGTANDLSS